MKKFTFIVKSPLGIHAKPATLLVQEMKKMTSDVKLEHHNRKVDAKNIISVLSLKVLRNDEVTFFIDGKNEDKEFIQLKNFCDRNL